ncbi:hypothetical protein M885DRAFT_543942 [Pelagophyceae sp. CCMP2097]|nr:hypothetical protein M885DRAFT_543942 [Pelagophyceae sp. CCMP2097]
MRVLVASCGLLAAQAYAPRCLALRRGLARRGAGGIEISVAEDDNEVRLGELIFSSRDPRMEVAQAPEDYGDEFCDFVSTKAAATDDFEERVALKSLVDMIKTVQQALVDEAAKKDGAAEVETVWEAPREILTDTRDILKAAKASTAMDLDSRDESGAPVPVVVEAGLQGTALATYSALLDQLVAAEVAGKLATEVEALFDRCDYSLLQLATSRREAAAEPVQLAAVVDAINTLAAQRLTIAAKRLQAVVRMGTPAKMMEKVAEMAAMDAIDVQFLELLDANRQQAAAAGPAGAQAAELMRNLANKCRDALDRKVGDGEPEKKLLRALLRADSADARERLLRRAFEPKEALQFGFADEQKTAGGPEVEPPKFIAACLSLIADFGNIDDNGKPFSERILAIADVAERIATEVFGESSTPKEQQDRMWHDSTTSVFDLEAAEFQAETQGDRMPWQNDDYDNMLPPGFDGETGIRRIGGQ